MMSSNRTGGRPTDRYGTDLIRPALLPGLLGSAACLAGLWASGTDWMITVLFAVSILGAIMVFFCAQALRVKRGLALTFMVLLVLIVIVFNPIAPFVLSASGTAWQLVQVASGAVMFAAGVLVRTPAPKA